MIRRSTTHRVEGGMFFWWALGLLASSQWHVCALLQVHSPDKGQAESAQGIWFDSKNAELGADVCVFMCGGVLIRTGPFPLSLHFFSLSYPMSLHRLPFFNKLDQTRPKKFMFTFCRKGMYTFESIDRCLAGCTLARFWLLNSMRMCLC